MKKPVFAAVFVLLVLATVIVTVVAAAQSYRYDRDPANGVDILEGFGAALLLVAGGALTLWELDLCYTLWYFFFRSKTVAQTLLQIGANLSLLAAIGGLFFPFSFGLREETEWLLLLFLYLILRIGFAWLANASCSRLKEERL